MGVGYENPEQTSLPRWVAADTRVPEGINQLRADHEEGCMEFKIVPIDVPEDDPFKNDALGRAHYIGVLNDFVKVLPGPFTIALNGAWGTGKTVFIKIGVRLYQIMGISVFTLMLGRMIFPTTLWLLSSRRWPH